MALAAAPLGGCGTVRNFAGGDPRPYGGVRQDVEFAETVEEARGKSGATATLLYWVADLCASAVADTLTLPILVCRGATQPPRAGTLTPEDCGHCDRPGQYSAGAVAAPAVP